MLPPVLWSRTPELAQRAQGCRGLWPCWPTRAWPASVAPTPAAEASRAHLPSSRSAPLPSFPLPSFPWCESTGHRAGRWWAEGSQRRRDSRQTNWPWAEAGKGHKMCLQVTAECFLGDQVLLDSSSCSIFGGPDLHPGAREEPQL